MSLGSSTQAPLPSGYLTVEIQRTGRAASVILSGELDLGSAHLVSDALLKLEAEFADPLVVDMSDIRFLNCSGLSVLLGAYNRALRDERRLSIVNVQPAVRKIFTLTGCRELLSGSDTESVKA